MTTSILVGGTLVGCAEEAPPEPMPELVAELIKDADTGEVAGFSHQGVNQWRGVPYAAPPVGDLRWRPPQPPEKGIEIFRAFTYGSPCKQIGHPLGTGGPDNHGKPVGDEDCLYLNIFAPQQSEEPAAVMVWIHGGSNMLGAGSDYDFSRLVAEEQVLVVTLNYRLGPFGWFSYQGLRDSAIGEREKSANFALLDILAALDWVRRNIAVFGGDPKRVTIFGESAGASNVLALLTSPLSRELVHGAIAQSGGTLSVSREQAESTEFGEGDPVGSGHLVAQWQQDHPSVNMTHDTEAVRARVVEITGDPLIEDPQVEAAIKLSAWLRSLDADYILETVFGSGDSALDGPLPNLPRLIRDGVVLPEEGATADNLRQKKSLAVPLLIGTNRDETKLFQAFDDELVSNWFGIQYFIDDEGVYDRVASYSSRAWKEYGADEVAANYPWPAWVYRFDWDEEPEIWFTDFSQLLGASHAFEIPFISGSMSLNPAADRIMFSEENLPAARLLSERMMAYWAEFARSGSPGEGGSRAGDEPLPHWTPYKLHRSYMVFDTEADGGLHMERDRQNLQLLWNTLTSDEAVADDAERCNIAWNMLRYTDLTPAQRTQRHREWRAGLCAPEAETASP